MVVIEATRGRATTQGAKQMTRTVRGRRLGGRERQAARRTATLALLAGTLAVGALGTTAGAATIATQLAAAVTVTSQAPATGKVGAAYRYDLVTSAGAARWSVVSGSLPAGLTLDAAGVLRGTPTAAGISTFVLRAVTASGTVHAPYTLVVRPASGASPLVVSPSSGPAAGGTTVRVPVPGAAWKQVEAGNYSPIGLADDGSVWAWGRQQVGTPGTPRPRPVRVPLPLPAGVYATTVGAGPWLSLVAASDGSVWMWGSGHAGDGTGLREVSTPTRVALTLPSGVRVVSLDAGAYHTVAVASDGSVWSWGENFLGQLGDGTLTDRTRPVRVPLPTGIRATQVTVGNNTTHVLATDGSVWGWGVNQSGAIGDGTSVNRTRPVRVTVPVAAGARVVQLTSGAGFGHALSSDGSLLGWGWNVVGQVGDGTTDNRLAPVRVALPAGVRLSSVGDGWDHGLGAGTDGRVWWWGRVDCREGGGECGEDSDVGPKNLTPVPHAVALPTGSKAVAVDGGEWNSLVVGADGSLSGWGHNNYGQLADGTTTLRDTAVLSRSPLTVTGVKVGLTYATGLKRLGPSTVSVVTPARTAGVVDVTLRTTQADGTPGPWTRLSGAWTYTP